MKPKKKIYDDCRQTKIARLIKEKRYQPIIDYENIYNTA